MKEIYIYVEGGGDTAQQRSELRTGMDRLLSAQKEAAQAKRMRWHTVPSGGRRGTYDAFANRVRLADENTIYVLLVDSESAIPAEIEGQPDLNAQTRKAHLVERDQWDLRKIAPACIHLMVQCMEAWIVADPDALRDYYGQGFRVRSLPLRANLEEEPRDVLYAKLARATKDTTKGEYSKGNHSKLKHASDLLARIDPKQVGARCPRFATFTSWLDRLIDNG